jgi:hypothetical protein
MGKIEHFSPALDYPSRRLWSLLDMLRFHADKFVSSMNLLCGLRRAIATNDPPIYDNEDLAEILRQQVKDFETMVEKMGLPVTRKAAHNLYVAMGGGIGAAIVPSGLKKLQAPSLEMHLKDIADRLRDELDGRLFLQVSRPDYFEPREALFGPEVEAKFPSANPEIEEAGKCLALQRPTACVMHLMRVLELGLHSLSREMEVPFQNENWNKIIDQIEAKIKGMSSVTHGAD